MICEGSGFLEGDSAMLLISLPADSTTPCLIQIYDFLYNPDSLLSYSIAVEARGSTSSNAPTTEDDLSLYWRIQLGCGSPDNKMSVLPPPAVLWTKLTRRFAWRGRADNGLRGHSAAYP